MTADYVASAQERGFCVTHGPELTPVPLALSTAETLKAAGTLETMPTGPGNLPQSEFWKRLVERAEELGWPISQNALAKKIGRSQGSVQAWVRGESLPAMKGAIEIAAKAQVCVQWLLTGEGPKFARPEDPQFSELAELWGNLSPERQSAVLRFAAFESAERARASPQSPGRATAFHAPQSVQDRPARYRTRK